MRVMSPTQTNSLLHIQYHSLYQHYYRIFHALLIHNFALKVIIHLPTKVDITVVYISDAMANTHTLNSMKQRYKPSKKPQIDSINAR